MASNNGNVLILQVWMAEAPHEGICGSHYISMGGGHFRRGNGPSGRNASPNSQALSFASLSLSKSVQDNATGTFTEYARTTIIHCVKRLNAMSYSSTSLKGQ